MLIVFMKIIDGLIETCCLGYKTVLKSRIVYKLHTFFYVHVTVHRNKFLYNKTN